MRCSPCSTEALGELKHLGPLCKACFEGVLHKRIRKEMRSQPWFKKDDRVLLVVDTHPRSVLLREAFSQIVQGLPLQVVEGTTIDTENYDRVVIPWTADDEVEAFLHEVLDNQPRQPEHPKLMKPLKSITEEELALFAKGRGLSVPPPSSRLRELMNDLEKRYPTTKFAVLKAMHT